MIEQKRWHCVRPCALVVLMSALAFGQVPRASAQKEASSQEKPQAAEKQAGGQSQDQSQSLKQQLEATEKLRKELEAELSRLRSQLDALQAKKGSTAPAAAATQPARQARRAPQARPSAEPGVFAGPQAGTLRGLQALREEPQAEQTHIKIFPLRHRDAQEMRQIVMILASPGGGASIIDGRGAAGAEGRSPVQPAGGIAAAVEASARPEQLRIVADPRSRSIIVRATDEMLKQVESLVAAFDVPPGTVPTLEDRKQGVFTVRHVDPEHVVKLLQELNVDVTRAPNTNTLSVRGSDTTLKEVGELIEALDVERKSEGDSGQG